MKRKPSHRVPNRTSVSRTRSVALIAGAAVVTLGAVLYFSSVGGTGSAGDPMTIQRPFARTPAQVQQFMDANRAITLTASQEATRVEALSAIPAACCRDSTADTCCCDCNLSRSIWGLAKTMIVGGAGAVEVRQAAQTWTKTLNPAGYAGDACYTGGCERSMQTDGCGGMNEDNLVF